MFHSCSRQFQCLRSFGTLPLGDRDHLTWQSPFLGVAMQGSLPPSLPTQDSGKSGANRRDKEGVCTHTHKHTHTHTLYQLNILIREKSNGTRLTTQSISTDGGINEELTRLSCKSLIKTRKTASQRKIQRGFG